MYLNGKKPTATAAVEGVVAAEAPAVPTPITTTEARKEPPKSRLWLVVVGSAVVLGCFVAYQIYLLNTAANDGVMALLGQRGDFFGGFLNPILTALTLGGLFYTLHLQRVEQQEARIQFLDTSAALTAQNAAIESQNYQTSFYHLLGTHNDIVNSLKTVDTNEEDQIVTGRDAFAVMYSRLTRIYRAKRRQFPDAEDGRILIFAWDEVFKEEQSQLAHYFRYLYNTIRLVSRGVDSEKYIPILRAQLSNQELLMLYYNCAVGQYGAPFADLAVQHQLFDNIPARLIEPKHGKLLPDAVFGKGGYAEVLRLAKPRVKGDMTDGGELQAKRAPRQSPTVAVSGNVASSSAKASSHRPSGPIAKLRSSSPPEDVPAKVSAPTRDRHKSGGQARGEATAKSEDAPGIPRPPRPPKAKG
ncbi:MAG: putative phage abortive infection protein [Candidatus Brevundimonas colombiensis]|uniref:Phage abortive infection protein n=1 Tax=Candidatus Brevundimonas colombiensis TaxID=3121376 RepID=A0AAJ5X526_9CAUL|nr:putative phage abortive infection protein [Brevundimonas sp.]WEK40530.1 MAG: putative phage abortive infection protein [Brevundimonas sp.]